MSTDETFSAEARVSSSEAGCLSWTNPAPQGRYDLAVIGSTMAATCAVREAGRLGGRVALIRPTASGRETEARSWAVGHALRRAAEQTHLLTEIELQGPRLQRPAPDFSAIMRWAGEVGARIAANESPERLSRGGVDVYLGQPVFTGQDALEIDGRRLAFRNAIIAAGARASRLAIDGASQSDSLTPGNLAEMAELPRRLAVIGTGPDACRWAQTFQRLGSTVYLVARETTILSGHEPDAVRLVGEQLDREGVRMRLGCDRLSIHRTGSQRTLVFERDGRKEKLFLDQILLTGPRIPDTAELGLDRAGVASTERGIVVGDRLQTTNRRIFAAGDVCGDDFSYLAVAEAMARLCAHNALRRVARKFDRDAAARIVWTDPEVVEIGLTPARAAARQIDIATYRAEAAPTASAALSRRGDGFAEIYVAPAAGRILGACVVGEQAGELAGPLTLLLRRKLSPAALADVIPCRPSRLEVFWRLVECYLAAPRPSWTARLAERCRHGWRRLRARRARLGSGRDEGAGGQKGA